MQELQRHLSPHAPHAKSTKRKKKHNDTHNQRKKEQDLPVSDIIKQISSLKQELISIQSKRKLQTLGVLTQNNSTDRKENKQQDYQKHPQSHQKPKIVLNGLENIGSRNIKLKFSISINKIKAYLERLCLRMQGGRKEFYDVVELIVGEFNTIINFIDCKFYDYECLRKEQQVKHRENQNQILSLSAKVQKLTFKNLSQKQMSVQKTEQIEELRRNLSYYLELMTSSKEEAEHLSKENEDLEKYVDELEQNNNGLRAEIKKIMTEKEQLIYSLSCQKQVGDKIRREFSLIQQDLKAKQVEVQKCRRQKKSAQSQLDQLNGQLDKFQNQQMEYTKKIRQLEKVNKQMIYELGVNQEQLAQLSSVVDKLTKEQNKLQKTIQVLREASSKNDQVFRVQQKINEQLKQELETTQKEKQKLQENIQFYRQEINNLSAEIDDLKRANERYKNMHFRNKVRGDEPHPEKKAKKRHGVEKSEALNQIFSIIEKHKNISEDRRYEDSSNDSF